MRSAYELKRECEKVNKLLLDDARKKGLGTKQSLKRLEDARQNDGTSYSYWAQLEYREYIRRVLERQDTISASHLIRGGAYRIGISPVTAKRYLSTLTSADGPFNQFRDLVMINPNYTCQEEDNYWTDTPVDQEKS